MNLHKKTQIGLLIFAFFVLVYFLSAKGKLEISDTDSSLKTAKTIIANHSLSAEGCQETDCHRSPKDGRYYSKHGLCLIKASANGTVAVEQIYIRIPKIRLQT